MVFLSEITRNRTIYMLCQNQGLAPNPRKGHPSWYGSLFPQEKACNMPGGHPWPLRTIRSVGLILHMKRIPVFSSSRDENICCYCVTHCICCHQDLVIYLLLCDFYMTISFSFARHYAPYHNTTIHKFYNTTHTGSGHTSDACSNVSG